MLPRKYRLDYYSFVKEKSPAIKKHLPIFTYIIKKTSDSKIKILITVSKSVSKLSSKRNKTKRIITEAIYSHIPHIRPGHWISIKPKRILSNLQGVKNILINDLKTLSIYA